MNNKLFSFTALLTSVLFLKEPSCSQTTDSKETLMHMSKGHEWVYRDSVVENGKLKATFFDTLRIERTSSFEATETFIFSDGKELMLRGDTIFQLVTQRGGYKFATPYFIASDQPVTFNYAFGGDVMIQRSVNRTDKCPPNSWSASGCYRISDGCRGEMVFLRGVGIINERVTDCRMPSQNFTSRTLVKFKAVK